MPHLLHAAAAVGAAYPVHILPELELLLDDELLLDELDVELDAPSLAASVVAAASGAGRPVVGTGWAGSCTVVSPPR